MDQMENEYESEAMPVDPMQPAEPMQTNIKRDTVAPGPSRASLVKTLIKKVENAKKHWKKSFDRMKEDTDFYMGKQWSSNDNDDRYVANIVQRHVGQRVSALYAKNPKFVAKRRETLDFAT